MSNQFVLIVVLLFLVTTACVEASGFAEEPMVPLVGDHGTNFDPVHLHPAPPEMRLGLRVFLEFYDKAGMEALKENLGNPNSLDYHRLVPHSEVMARFGPRKKRH